MPLALVVCCLLTACGKEGKRKDYAKELAPQLPSGCIVETGDANSTFLFVFCQQTEEADEKAAKAKVLVEERCGGISEQGFLKVQVAGEQKAWTAEVRDGACSFTENPAMEIPKE